MSRPAGQTPFDCPNCGALVPAGALCCPQCGSDDETGWSDDTMYDHADIPGSGYARRDLDEPAAPRRAVKWQPVIALILIAAFIAWLLSAAF